MGKKKKKGKKISLDEFLKKYENKEKSTSVVATEVRNVQPPKSSSGDEISLRELREIDREDLVNGNEYDIGFNNVNFNRNVFENERSFNRNVFNNTERRNYNPRMKNPDLKVISAPYVVWMGNLDYDAVEMDVRHFFETRGVDVQRVRMPYGMKKGFCFIKFTDEVAAKKVIDGGLLSGEILSRRFYLQEVEKEKAFSIFREEEQGERMIPEFGSKRSNHRNNNLRREYNNRRYPINQFQDRKFEESEDEKFKGFGTKKASNPVPRNQTRRRNEGGMINQKRFNRNRYTPPSRNRENLTNPFGKATPKKRNEVGEERFERFMKDRMKVSSEGKKEFENRNFFGRRRATPRRIENNVNSKFVGNYSRPSRTTARAD